AAAFLATRMPLPAVAKLADSDAGWDPAGWDALRQLGWLDAELGLLEHAGLLGEAGYALLPAPDFSAGALAGPADDGRARPTLAWAEAGRPAGLFPADPATAVSAAGAVTGEKVLVPDAGWVDAFLVTCAGGALRLVRAEHAGVTEQPTMDSTRR